MRLIIERQPGQTSGGVEAGMADRLEWLGNSRVCRIDGIMHSA